ncbi:TonB-dependent receptor [Ferruginibacter sp.]|uniref:SusC/RagA family TonB-linked outer membrane protein n=1 Tax=Ferruginibacter sp. TaxID=1940288 RepID=UPI00265B1C73|nr:TonB-dependent receptor [Ferruginibacter sp.]
MISSRLLHGALAIFLFVAWPLFSLAQNHSLKGVVKDQLSNPVQGASVSIKGSDKSMGTTTLEDGSFNLQLPAAVGSIEVTIVGYKNKMVAVKEGSSIVVQLQESTSQLAEVVMIGYGTQKKSNLTGAVASISNKDFKNQPLSNLANSIQGKLSGINVTSPSGTPGAGLLVSIRGAQNPLYVVDGIPMLSESNSSLSTSFNTTGEEVGQGQNISSISDINPDDIESIEILKDPSSAAIYGARASNGVVLVTTKKGKAGKTQTGFNMYTGIQQVAKKIKFMNSTQFVDMVQEARANDLKIYNADNTAFGPDFDPTVLTDPLAYSAGTTNTVWLDQIFRTAPINNYELNLKGGNEKTKFYIGAGYFDQQGIVIENYFKRMNARINIDHSINDKFSVGVNLSMSKSLNHRSFNDDTYSGIVTNAIGASPLMPVYDPNGNYAKFEDYQASWLSDNPVKSAHEIKGFTDGYRFTGTAFGEYKINKNFKFRTSWSTDYAALTDKLFLSPITTDGAPIGGRATKANFNSTTWLNENIFNYQKSIGKHSIGALAGFTQQGTTSDRNATAGQGFPLGSSLSDVSVAAIITRIPVTPGGNNRLHSYLARLTYDYDGKYLLSAVLRTDGSSRFPRGKQYGYFPSVSAGWNLNKERFMEDSKVLTALKVRASYGFTGDQEIGDYQNKPLWQPAVYNGQSGLKPKLIVDPNLTWQKNKGANVGIDYEFFGGLISGSADYFINTRTDLLNYVPIAGTTGFATLLINGGSVQDKGWEFNVTSRNINSNNFRWTTNFNITYQKNTLLKTPVDNQQLSAFNDLSPTHILKVGQPVGSFWGIKYKGVNPQTGSPMYEDLNKDGVIDANDAQVLGHARPDYFGGLSNSFKYKNLELMVATQFSIGNKVYNLIRPVWENLGYSNNGGLTQVYANNSVNSLKRWQKPGDVTDVPRYSFVNKNYIENSSMFVENGSFFRIRTVNLTYTFNKKMKMFNNLQVYAEVQNLYVFTKYKGFDPEVSSNGGNQDRTAGVDYAAYPPARTFTLGVNLSF